MRRRRKSARITINTAHVEYVTAKRHYAHVDCRARRLHQEHITGRADDGRSWVSAATGRAADARAYSAARQVGCPTSWVLNKRTRGDKELLDVSGGRGSVEERFRGQDPITRQRSEGAEGEARTLG